MTGSPPDNHVGGCGSLRIAGSVEQIEHSRRVAIPNVVRSRQAGDILKSSPERRSHRGTAAQDDPELSYEL